MIVGNHLMYDKFLVRDDSHLWTALLTLSASNFSYCTTCWIPDPLPPMGAFTGGWINRTTITF
ncbi:MAG: hypothetical protein JO327_00575 [Nitrososphaeraceae archaeon]|nr:hypothetical protein [Nitrososphaeraceae archaeon]MBV9666600.1 hypothetical protein [Nitrososphaeraceae archaeon]